MQNSALKSPSEAFRDFAMGIFVFYLYLSALSGNYVVTRQTDLCQT
jgi:hypothetical protein